MNSIVSIGKFKRPLARIIFAAGMLLAFIGFFLPMISIEDEGLFNLFTAGIYFNEPGCAYISTFLYVTWLACLVGVIVLFTSPHVIVGDFFTWLIACGFGIAATVTLWSELEVIPFGYMFIGSYVVFVGMTTALVALIYEAINIRR